jgi:hypothetical protein
MRNAIEFWIDARCPAGSGYTGWDSRILDNAGGGGMKWGRHV